jgi:hypothetical protein
MIFWGHDISDLVFILSFVQGLYHGSILLTTTSEHLYYQYSCILTYLLINIYFMLIVFMLCLHYSHLPPAYAHLYMLMVYYVCLCMLM